MTAAKKPLPRSYELAASAFTGSAVIAITNPLDCLKQRWQIAPTQSHAGLLSFTRGILRQEGLAGLWLPGLTTNVIACTYSVGVRLGLYPILRDSLSPDAGSRSKTSMFISGLAGGALGYTLSAPFFAASRVAQAETGTAAASHSLSTLARMARADGVLGLWRGAEVLILRGALLSASQLTTYDVVKRQLKASGLEDGPVVHSIASFTTALSVATAICPFDLTYTALLTRPSGQSTLACVGSLLREHGPLHFFRGWTTIWARFVPSGLLTFHIYEQTRRLLGGEYLQ